ncbi:MAG: hypothetical protein AAB582_02570 [Patescibacteria group bacterium]
MTQESDASFPTSSADHRAETRRKSLQAFRKMLDEPESEKEDRFAVLIQTARQLIDDKTLHDHFAVSRVTINHWASGVVPGPHAHANAIRLLKELADTELK